MSTSSENSTPGGGDWAAVDETRTLETTWDEFVEVVSGEPVREFEAWLDEELFQLERELDRFVTKGSRSSGCR